MNRKRRKQRKTSAAGSGPQGSLSLEELEARGAGLLQAGKYREAVADFKELLKHERRPKWIASLAEAYAGRARGLADKGMFSEAAVIWRNRAEICGQSLAEPAYIELLFQGGQIDTASRLIREQRGRIEQRGALPRLRELCAVQVLAGREGLLDLFADDDPLRRDFPAARAALQSWCEGQDADMERQLKAIAFRSPFRDFRQILKALCLLDTDPSGAEALLERVDAESPFHSLGETIRASRLPAPEFLHRYQDMGAAERHFASTLKGWSARQLALANELRQLGDRPGADRLLRFVLRNKGVLGEEYVREIAMRALVSDPRGEAAVNESLGRLTKFERERIAALREEQEGYPNDVFNAWHDVCLVLDEPRVRQDPDTALTLALIQRRMARNWLRTEPPDTAVLTALENALRCDPDDQPAWLELIRLYRGMKRLKEARRLLDEALSRYPEDTAVLTEAVETAIAGGAFKKATRYARRALELDPINTGVRDILLNSHLAHARKQIRQHKFPLARRELEEAQNWARTEQARGRIDLLRGILELSVGDVETARRQFMSGFERTGGGLVGRFELLVEAVRMERHLATVVKQARIPKPPWRVNREQVLALLHAIAEVGDEDEDTLAAAVAFMDRPLRGAARLDFSPAEMEHLCEIWLRLHQRELRKRYARAALKRWPDAPVFVFHEIDASQDMFAVLSAAEHQRLENAWESARADGDMRTAHRIGELLDGGMPVMRPGDEPFDPAGFGPGPGSLPRGQDLEQLIDMLLEGGGPPEVEEMKRVLGPEGARMLLRKLLQGDFDPDDVANALEGLPRPKGRRKRSHKKPKKPGPGQLDLF